MRLAVGDAQRIHKVRIAVLGGGQKVGRRRSSGTCTIKPCRMARGVHCSHVQTLSCIVLPQYGSLAVWLERTH